MTDDLNTHPAATTTEAPASPGAEGTSAQTTTQTADLDSLLNQFTTETTATPAASPASPTQPKAEPAAVDVEARKELAALKFEREFKPVLEQVRGDIPKDVLSDEELTDLIDGRAKRDPRLQNAWNNRAANPKAWSGVQKALSAEIAKKFSKLPDPNATEDREAVTAAVRGASPKAPAEKAPNYGAMTNAEFQAEKARLGL